MPLWVALTAAVTGITAPNTSLATVPVGYFGGNAAHRGNASIEMLAKCRIVMIEKWEGHCWADCLANPNSTACLPECDVESLILDTLTRVKAINPSVSTVMYFNTLLDFPFYKVHGNFQSQGADTIDSTSTKPIILRNDNGMNGIYVFGFDTDVGVQLYIDFIKNMTATGVVDGFFGDKWNDGAVEQNGEWVICNHLCGNVSEQQGMAWNAGKKKALTAATDIVGDGPYFANGPPFEGDGSNFNGHWKDTPWLRKGDPRDGIAEVKKLLANLTYVYASATGDQKWNVDPNSPSSLQGACVGDCLARFLLAVEKGVFLGANGWDESYDKPLGDPVGDAVYTPAGAGKPATLRRDFASGTYVVFTYTSATKGSGEIFWGGKPLPPPQLHKMM